MRCRIPPVAPGQAFRLRLRANDIDLRPVERSKVLDLDAVLPVAVVSDEEPLIVVAESRCTGQTPLLSGILSSKSEAIEPASKKASLIDFNTESHIPSAGYRQAVSQLLYSGIACTSDAREREAM